MSEKRNSIIRVKKGKDLFAYKMIASHPANDTRLSWKARGILWYLLDKPDDWEVIVEDLINKSEVDGETVVRNALKELQQKGYIKRYQDRVSRGKFGRWITEVYELPFEIQVTVAERQPGEIEEEEGNLSDSPHRGFPHADKPDAEKPNAEKPRSENQGLPIMKYTYYELKEEEGEEAGAVPTREEESGAVQNKDMRSPLIAQGVARISEKFFDVFGLMMSGYQQEVLLSYLDDGMEPEVVIYALEQTAENNANTTKYTLRILSNWLKQGVRTVEDAKAAVRKFESNRRSKQPIAAVVPPKWQTGIDFTRFREN